MSKKSSLDRMMEKFLTEDATYGELMDVAMSIARWGDEAMRDAYVNAYADMILRVNDEVDSHDEAVQMVKENLGYLCGYYDSDTAEMMFSFYDMEHPIFGRKAPTAEEAIEMGKAWASGNL